MLYIYICVCVCDYNALYKYKYKGKICMLYFLVDLLGYSGAGALSWDTLWNLYIYI